MFNRGDLSDSLRCHFFMPPIIPLLDCAQIVPVKHALAVTVEPFKFSPAEPVAYELSYILFYRSGLYGDNQTRNIFEVMIFGK